MKTILLTAAAAAVLAAASPAAAVTFDAFATFNGTQGAGNYTYGVFNSGVFTPFANNTNCAFTGSVCLNDGNPALVPQASKGGSPAFQYGTVDIPADALVLHPGDANATYLAFIAPTAGNYTFAGTFTIADRQPTGVSIVGFNTVGGLTTFGSATALSSGSTSLGGTIFLNVGDIVGAYVGSAGNFSDDSVGVNFTAAVPEPATWGMMLLGFGLVGAGLRRRTARTVAA